MRVEDLHDVIHEQPFQPFALMLADGTRLHVPHPDWISHPSTARKVVVWGEDERLHILDIALLLGVVLDAPVPPGSIAPNPNGEE